MTSKRTQRWTDRWQGFYDAVTRFFPTYPMAQRAAMADDYIGRNLIYVDVHHRSKYIELEKKEQCLDG